MSFSLGNLISAGVQSDAGYLRGQVQGNEIAYERNVRQQQLQRQADMEKRQRQAMLQEALLREAQIKELGQRHQPAVATPFDPANDKPLQRALYLRQHPAPKAPATLSPGESNANANAESEGQAILRNIPPGSQIKFMRAYGAALKANPGVSPGRIAVHVWQGMKATDPTITPQRAKGGLFDNLTGAPDSTAKGPAGGPTVGAEAQDEVIPDDPQPVDTSAADPSTLPLLPADIQRAKTDTAYASFLRNLGHQI